MAYYKNVSLPISNMHMLIKKGSVIEPLCNTCRSKDCENIIERKNVSIYGIIRNWRLIKISGNYESVATCDGYFFDQE